MAKSQPDPIRILYVEDDPGMARLVQKRLQREGYVVDLASDGEEGIAKFEKDRCDVLFLDQTLPVHDGLEVIKILTSKGPLPPTIMITGTGDEKTAVESMKLGASDYIVKDTAGGYLNLLPSITEKVLQQQRAVEEKQRAEQGLQDAKNKVENLHEVASLLATRTNEEEVYHLVVDAAKKILTFSFCSMGIIEGGQIVTKLTSPTKNPAIPADKEIERKTLKDRKTHITDTSHKDQKHKTSKPHYHSLISIPIEGLGVFQVASADPNAFTKNDTRLLDLLIGHTAAAIKRIRLQDELKEQAIHDPLTGLHNRYYLDKVLDQEIARSKRYKHDMAFLMIDVNGFKEINDQFGHQVGDKILQGVAHLLRDTVRESDIVVRYGGDEFLVILLETNGEAEIVKKRIANKVARRSWKDEGFDFKVTLSIGSSFWHPGMSTSVDNILHEADNNMYEDKRKQNGVRQLRANTADK